MNNIIIKIYKIYKDGKEILGSEYTKNNVQVASNEFYGLTLNKDLLLKLSAINDHNLGTILSIENITYRKEETVCIKTNLYEKIILKIKSE